jgi:integrase
MIAEHKAKLLAARPRIEPTWLHESEPDRLYVGKNGSRVMATQRELLYLDANGNVIRRRPNGGPGHQIVGLERRLGIPFPVPIAIDPDAPERPKLAIKNGDDVIFDTYLEQASITGYFEREARSVWALYKQLTNNRPLKDATRDDGRKIAAYFSDQGIKSATIRKKLMWLAAAVNLAIGDGILKFNPFSGVVAKRNDEQMRLPLDDADIRNIKHNLGSLHNSDQLLIRLLATTGMRLSEAFEIDCDRKERGCRYVIVGSKTPQSRRRVPLPSCALAHLPESITGPLFQGGAHAASKRLNRFLNQIGIADRRKVVHSFRHRAQDRLRAAGCPEDVRWALLGHEKRTVAAGYGAGFPVPLLRQWIDYIGF